MDRKFQMNTNGNSELDDRLYEFERDNEVLSILPSESLDEYKQRVGYYNPTNLVGYSYTRFLRFVNNKILRGLK
jgi:hypothetical protein